MQQRIEKSEYTSRHVGQDYVTCVLRSSPGNNVTRSELEHHPHAVALQKRHAQHRPDHQQRHVFTSKRR